MSGQRARSAIPADHRSAHPSFAGVPWWGAVLIAVAASAVGFAVDAASGGGELTKVFAALYAIGCLAAVLAVRQTAVFTAVIQPPLILFVLVPSAYYLMHSADIDGVKDVLINCGYPLIERFPLMFFTAAAVLLVGAARWYFGASSDRDTASEKTPRTGGGLFAKVSSLLGGGQTADSAEPDSRRRHSGDRRTRGAANPAAKAAARSARPAKRAASPSRSRHARPPDTEIIQPVVDADRPRRRRPRPTEPQPDPSAEPRRRTRTSSGRDRRGSVPPDERRATYDRAERRERERPQRSQRPQRPGPYEDWSGYAERDPYEPFDPRRPSASSSHHPISRVRYRGADDSDGRAEYRSPRRAPRDAEPDRWEYDI
ncbi:MAG: DUF6542 domain-containing protein [Mycobacterium sp.]